VFWLGKCCFGIYGKIKANKIINQILAHQADGSATNLK
jgi:hypothetical protein